MTHPLEVAIGIAIEAHGGVLDKSGQPYIMHPLRVMLAQVIDVARIVGVLHDVVEDTDVTIENLRDAGIPEDALTAIVLLTHADDVAYEDYVRRLKHNPIACSVKLADLRDNMDVLRLPGFTPRDLDRLAKYRRAYEFLMHDD